MLKIAADPNGALKFDKSSLSAKAGKVTIVMDNPSSIPHAVEIEGERHREEGRGRHEGRSVSRVTADLKAGKYEFYCPVDGHKAAGMKGDANRPARSTGRPGTGDDCMIEVVV